MLSQDFLVNNIYPPDYWKLDGTDNVKFADELFWASKQRFAAVNPDSPSDYMKFSDGGIRTSEYLEIDLGRIRQLNYMGFNILRAPIHITVEYDALSTDDGTHSWQEVKPLADMSFDDDVHYVANVKNPYFLAEFYFTDAKNNPVNTRYIRLQFRRKDVEWPTRNASPFRWPIIVKSFRSARYIAETKDVMGLLFGNLPGDTLLSLQADPVDPNQSLEVRQRFALPSDAQRGNIDPRIMGFGFLANVIDADLASWTWSVWDVTDDANPDIPLKQGTEHKATSTGEVWIDIYFDISAPIFTDASDLRIYEIRLQSANINAANAFFLQTPANIPGVEVDGTWDFVNHTNTVKTSQNLAAELSSGDWISKTSGFDGAWKVNTVVWNGTQTILTLAQSFVGTTESVPIFKAQPFQYFDVDTQTYINTFDQNLSLRLWADVATSGKDVLGNYYRHGTYYDAAADINNNAKAGWISSPQPSPEAVESLYFDVRSLDSNNVPITNVIDAINIAPRTPGIRMHVYYTDQNLNAVAADGSLRSPDSNNQWDSLLWTPINATYILRGNSTFVLPKPVRAAYIKLEFSKLQPLPFKLPAAPKLPHVHYHRYPTWVENQFDNSTVRRVVQDWFVKNKTPIMVNVLKHISDPVLEFQYKEREFLAALAVDKKLGKSAQPSGLVDTRQDAFIDPVTGSKIFFDARGMYKGNLTATVDTDSILGQNVRDKLDPKVQGDPIEGEINVSTSNTPIVSTSNDRISESFSHLAQTPMWFNRVCRHKYKVEKAQFNQKAYFAGITLVRFLRRDYTQATNDPIMIENIQDAVNLEENSFIVSDTSRLKIALSQSTITLEPVTAYASYTVDDVIYTDEPVTFIDETTSIPLLGTGDPATNLILTSEPDGNGIQYQLGIDYDLVYTTDPDTGDLINSLTVFTLPLQYGVHSRKNYADSYVFVSRSSIKTILDKYTKTLVPVVIDQGFMTGVSVITSTDTRASVDSGTVTAAASITGTTAAGYADSGTVTSVSSITSTDVYTPTGNVAYTDSGTVTGVPSITTVTEARGTVESATVTSTAVLTWDDEVLFDDSITFENFSIGGVAIRQGAVGKDYVDTINGTQFATYPDAKFMSVWVRWSSIQPSGPTDFNWNSILSSVGGSTVTLDQSIDHAINNAYGIIFRVSCGSDAPSWLYNGAIAQVGGTPKACTEMRLIGTQGTPAPISLPLFWDANLNYWYDQLIQKLATQFSGQTAAGTPRSQAIYFMPVAMPTEMGTEMNMGYGKVGSYLPANTTPTTTNTAFLSSGITATTANGATLPITVPVGAGTYPSGDILIKIDQELLFVNHTGSTFTLKNSGRGWSGSTAITHATNALVTYIDTTAAGYFSDTTNYFGTSNAPYDILTFNTGKWLAQGTVTSNRNNTTQAWKDGIDIHMNRLNSLNIHPSIALGSLWSDHYVGAIDIVQTKGTQYGDDVWAMTTNLQPGKDASNNPTKVFGGVTQSTYYGGYNGYAANAMLAAQNYGCTIGFQMADISLFNLFSNPFIGPTSAFQTVVEDSLPVWQPTFLEMSDDILTTNSPPASGTISTKTYLLG